MKNFISANSYCKHITDGTHDSPGYTKSGFHLLTSKYIIGGKLNIKDSPLISETDYNKINERSKVEQWDILFSMIGTVGEVCLVNKYPSFAIKNMGLFKCKNEIDAKFLYYYFQSPLAKVKNTELLAGSTQQYITLSNLKSYPIPEFNCESKQHIVNTNSSNNLI